MGLLGWSQAERDLHSPRPAIRGDHPPDGELLVLRLMVLLPCMIGFLLYFSQVMEEAQTLPALGGLDRRVGVRMTSW